MLHINAENYAFKLLTTRHTKVSMCASMTKNDDEPSYIITPSDPIESPYDKDRTIFIISLKASRSTKMQLKRTCRFVLNEVLMEIWNTPRVDGLQENT